MPKFKENRQPPDQGNNWRPDWREENEYLRYENIPPEHWAWEFLRRNASYLKAWEHYEQTGIKPDTATLRQAFGITRLADPKTEWEHGGVWIPDENRKNSWNSLAFDMFPEIEIVDWSDKRAFIEGRGMSPDEFATKTQPQAMEEVVVKFNLMNDIKSQLTAVEMLLKIHRQLSRKLYKIAGSDKVQRFSIERCRSQFAQYLRLLDAEVQLKAKDDEVFLKQVQPILAPTYDNRYAAKDQIKRLKTNLVRARVMRDHEYRSLAHVTHLKKLPSSKDDIDTESSEVPKSRNKRQLKKPGRDPRTKRFTSKQREK